MIFDCLVNVLVFSIDSNIMIQCGCGLQYEKNDLNSCIKRSINLCVQKVSLSLSTIEEAELGFE